MQQLTLSKLTMICSGFVVEDDPEAPFFPIGVNGKRLKRVPVSPAALRFLLETEPSVTFSLSESQLDDKSKADGISKTLVVVQGIC